GPPGGRPAAGPAGGGRGGLDRGDHAAGHEAGGPHRSPAPGQLGHLHQTPPVHHLHAPPGAGGHDLVGPGPVARVDHNLDPVTLHYSCLYPQPGLQKMISLIAEISRSTETNSRRAVGGRRRPRRAPSSPPTVAPAATSAAAPHETCANPRNTAAAVPLTIVTRMFLAPFTRCRVSSRNVPSMPMTRTPWAAPK